MFWCRQDEIEQMGHIARIAWELDPIKSLNRREVGFLDEGVVKPERGQRKHLE